MTDRLPKERRGGKKPEKKKGRKTSTDGKIRNTKSEQTRKQKGNIRPKRKRNRKKVSPLPQGGKFRTDSHNSIQKHI